MKMGVLSKVSPRRLITVTKLLSYGRPRCLKLVREVVTAKKGIEIGGPSAVFRRKFNLPVYDCVGTLDNCDFSQNTTWSNHTPDFVFNKAKPSGRTYFCEGSDLKPVADHTYDFLLSSHNLEHLANPFKGLREWQRVVVPGGYLAVVLPHYAHTPDRRRKPTSVDHMLEDFRNNVGEDDLTHVDEILEAYLLQPGSRPYEEMRARLLNNYSHRMIHHHVFDEANSREMFEAAGFKVLSVEMQPPFHIISIMQLP